MHKLHAILDGDTSFSKPNKTAEHWSVDSSAFGLQFPLISDPKERMIDVGEMVEKGGVMIKEQRS